MVQTVKPSALSVVTGLHRRRAAVGEASVHLAREARELLGQPRSRAVIVLEPAVHGEHAVGVAGVATVLDAVAAADVGAELHKAVPAGLRERAVGEHAVSAIGVVGPVRGCMTSKVVVPLASVRLTRCPPVMAVDESVGEYPSSPFSP